MRELNYIDKTIEKNENPALRMGTVGRGALSTVYLMDCIEGMKQFPDKFFDLAVVDPPYGIGEDGGKKRTSPKRPNSYVNYKKHNKKDWDKEPPSIEYFNELMRVSKNQIIWGANHFIERIPNANSSCWIVWDKNMGGDFADCELAWCSFKTAVRKVFGHPFIGTNGGVDRIHPTQKPLFLYDWILHKYANEGNLILDTHLGSQSSRIAANNARLDFVGFEIDREYFDNGNKRFENVVSQGVLF